MRVRSWSEQEIAILEALAATAATEIALRETATTATVLARTLQEGLLPPTTPKLPGFAVATDYRSAENGTKLVGDFFDVFESARGQWHVAIGDVQGHGPQAAMVAARVRYALRAVALGSTGPAEILARVNQTLLEEGIARLCTLALVNIDVSGALVCVASAGHPPPVLAHAGARAEFLTTQGLLLGAYAFGPEELHEVDVRLAARDTLILYTDGITEGHRLRGLGEDALLAIVDQASAESLDRLMGHLQRATTEQAGSSAREDDAAVLLLPPITLAPGPR